MRKVANAERIQALMSSLATHAHEATRVYFAGGATAVLVGWRETTVDVDIRMEPESDDVLRAIPVIKEDLEINVEFATPLDFIPVAQDWRKRSKFIAAQGNISYFHFDLYAQALAKVERQHSQDLIDLAEMVARGLVNPDQVIAYFEAVEKDLYRYPAIDAASFRTAVLEYFSR